MRALSDRLRADGIDAWIDQYSPAPSEGWPMWMEAQIQKADFVLLVCTETYLRRVEHREEPGKGRGVLWEAKLIYNALYLDDTRVQKYIPVLFADGQPSWIPQSLRGLAHYRLDATGGYEDLYRHLTNQPGVQVPPLGTLRPLPAREPASFPASPLAKPTNAPTALEQKHRAQLIKQVRLDWIEGVLDQSLYQVARIELGLASRTDAVEQPLNAIVQVPDRKPREVAPGTPISQIFDDQAGAMLILGAPGTGKTTMLLELARDLLVRAGHDASHPVPVVFNLSSWAARREALTDWMITELNERSYVPKKVARQWIEREQIIPLLDGLDEAAGLHREACVEAINTFRREHGLIPIAVCSRIADYEALGLKLRMRTAIEVQSLSRLQVQDYLDRVESLWALRAAVENDPALGELLETPLMLWVAMLAYRDEPHVPTHDKSLEQRRDKLFAHFVAAMFKRRAGKRRYSIDQTTGWLSYLARTMVKSNQTVLYLENLDYHYLPTRMQRGLARGTLSVFNGLLFGLIFMLVDSDGLLGVLLGLAIGLAPHSRSLRHTKTWQISSVNGITHMIAKLVFAIWSISGLASLLWFVLRGVLITGELRAGLRLGLSAVLMGLPFAMIWGGLFVVQHLVLRLFLWANDYAPLRYLTFLAHVKDLLFLRRVGDGGYIFTHRLLRDYFASLPQPTRRSSPVRPVP